MRLRRASVITALSLLASAATAHAECAWVLWQRLEMIAQGNNYVDWTPTGVPNFPDCDASLKSTMKLHSGPELGTTVEVRGNQIQRKGPVTWIHTYFCLPDTVDPRAPKGK
jgi:hypothetical protein